MLDNEFLELLDQMENGIKNITLDILQRRKNKVWSLYNNGILEYGCDVIEEIRKRAKRRIRCDNGN